MVVLSPCGSKTPRHFYFIVISFRSVYAGRFQLKHGIFQCGLRILVSRGTIHYWKMNTCQECHGRAHCLQRCKQILESGHSPEVRDRHRDWWFPDELERQSLLLSCQPEILNSVQRQLETFPVFTDCACNNSTAKVRLYKFATMNSGCSRNCSWLPPPPSAVLSWSFGYMMAS